MNCAYCGTPFEPKAVDTPYAKRFCSPRCRARWHWDHHGGRDRDLPPEEIERRFAFALSRIRLRRKG